jgi:hypothetical protein
MAALLASPFEDRMPARVTAFIDNLVFARGYTVELLATIREGDWFTMPAECPSHVGWQVGHLAIAEARLILERVGGRDFYAEGLVPTDYLKLFGRGSVPDPDPGRYPAPADIRRVFDRVQEAALQTLRDTADADLETLVQGSPHRSIGCRGPSGRPGARMSGRSQSRVRGVVGPA